MSVRNVYQVLVDGQTVFSGSVAICRSVYEALCNQMELFDEKHDVVLCFKPNIKGGD